MSDKSDDVEDPGIQSGIITAVSSGLSDEETEGLTELSALKIAIVRDYDEKIAIDFITEHPEFVIKNPEHAAKEDNASDIQIPGKSLLMLAAERGKSEILKCIIQIQFKNDSGSPVTETWEALRLIATDYPATNVKDILGAWPGICDRRDEDGDTLLLKAARSGDSSLVEWLLDSEVDVMMADDDGNTALHLACQGGKPDDPTSVTTEYEKIIELILNKRSGLLARRNRKGRTPLLVAARYGRPSICNVIMAKKDANISAQDSDGNTALHLICSLNEPFSSSENIQEGLLEVVKSLLKKTPSLHNKQNEDQETALLIAAEHGHFHLVQHLCKLPGAKIEARDRWGYTPLLNSAYADSDSERILKFLLDLKANPTVKNGYGNNVLHVACMHGHSSIVEILLAIPQTQLKKLMVEPDSYNQTPLAAAASWGYPKIVSQLLQSKFYFPENPALDEVYLSPDSEKEEVSEWLLRKFQQKRNQQESDEHQDIDEHMFTPECARAVFYWALLNTNHDKDDDLVAILHKDYGPKLVDRGNSTWLHVVALVGNTKMLQCITNWKSDVLKEADKKTTPLHVAAGRGHLEFLEELLNSRKEEDSRTEESGSQAILNAILQETEDLDTLISLAASQGHLKVEKRLWDMVFEITQEDGSFSRTSLAIRAGSQRPDQTVLRPEQGGQEQDTQEQATQEEEETEEDRQEKNTQERNRQLVMGAATWRLMTGESRYFYGFRNLIERRDSNETPPNDKNSTLEFLAQNNFPIALWWLLSDSDSFYETRLEECKTVLSKFTPTSNQHNFPYVANAAGLVKELLEKPPRQRIPKEERGLPQFQFDEPLENTHSGTVLDVLIKDDSPIVFKPQPADIVNIVYRRGPRRVMLNSSPQISSNSKSLARIKEKLFSPSTEFDTPTTTDLSEGKEDFSDLAKSRFRWVHIPENNLQFVKDLLTQLCREKDISRGKHRRLMAQLSKSYLEVPSGEGTSYMRPHCQFDELEKVHLMAFYMPYVSWGDMRVKQQTATLDEKQKNDAQAVYGDSQNSGPTGFSGRKVTDTTHITGADNIDQQKLYWPEEKKPPIKTVHHKALTLDQYYYESLNNTYDRDRDQVLWRLFEDERKLHRLQIEQAREKEEKEEKERNAIPFRLRVKAENKVNSLREDPQKPHEIITGEVNPTQILMVNQLWLWKLGDDTIITSTTEDSTKVKPFLKRVIEGDHWADLHNIQQDGNESQINHVADLIIDTARNLFNAREIAIDNSGDRDIAPLDAYRQAIQDMRELETLLFKKFRFSLDKKRDESSKGRTSIFPLKRPSSQTQTDVEKENPSSVSPDSLKNVRRGGKEFDLSEASDEYKENPYQDISRETGLLMEIKDILDELNILKKLAHDQDRVSDMWGKIKSKQKTSYPATTSEISLEIQGMIEDAQSVQRDINTLLDLKQKEASILEAKATREQSDALMTFTVVTIIFLPASFLTSLFALNVSDFPHQNGNVEYKGWWIFPIIFGVSFIVSAFFVLLAFNANWLKKILQQRKDRKEKKANTRKQNEKETEKKDEKPGLSHRSLGRLHGEKHINSRKGAKQC